MGHWETQTFIAGFRKTGIVAPMLIKGAMNGEAFLAYIEQCLAPTLGRRDIVVIDNVPVHKVAGVVEAIQARVAVLAGPVCGSVQGSIQVRSDRESESPTGARTGTGSNVADDSNSIRNAREIFVRLRPYIKKSWTVDAGQLDEKCRSLKGCEVLQGRKPNFIPIRGII